MNGKDVSRNGSVKDVEGATRNEHVLEVQVERSPVAQRTVMDRVGEGAEARTSPQSASSFLPGLLALPSEKRRKSLAMVGR